MGSLGGSSGGARSRSAKAAAQQAGGCYVLKCSEDSRGQLVMHLGTQTTVLSGTLAPLASHSEKDDTGFREGDLVKVTKQGKQFGFIGKVINAQWHGMVKVEMISGNDIGGIKNYALEFLEAQELSRSISKAESKRKTKK